MRSHLLQAIKASITDLLFLSRVHKQGLGSDVGGSIRMPAFFNGVFGHKPSSGVVPSTGQHPIAHNQAQYYLSTGPLCRYASDLMPLLHILSGQDEHDAGLLFSRSRSLSFNALIRFQFDLKCRDSDERMGRKASKTVEVNYPHTVDVLGHPEDVDVSRLKVYWIDSNDAPLVSKVRPDIRDIIKQLISSSPSSS